MKKKSNNKYQWKIIILILLIIALTGVISYAAFFTSRTQSADNEILSGCFSTSLTAESASIALTKAFPMTDEEGSQLTPYTFTLNNTCNLAADYYIIVSSTTGSFTNDYVNYQLDDTIVTDVELPGDRYETVFEIPGKCTFTASGTNTNITSPTNDCISTTNPTGSPIDYTATSNRYINTGVGLYTSANHDRDYIISFEIENYDSSSQVKQATLMNTKREASGYPGLVFRAKDGEPTTFELGSRKTSGANEIAYITASTLSKMTIYRTDQEIYYSVNDATPPTWLNDLTEYNPQFDTTVWFGATPTNANATAAQRYFTGTLKNMIIRVEKDEEDIEPIITQTTVPSITQGTLSDADTNTLGIDSGYSESYIIGQGSINQGQSKTLQVRVWLNEDAVYNQIHGQSWSGQIKVVSRVKKNQPTVRYTVHFESNGGSSVENMTVNAGSALGSLPEAPTKTNKTFAGWYEDNETFLIPVTTATVPLGETTYYAKWNPIIYTIHFASNGGSSVGDMTVNAGESLGSLPEAPTRDDYTFAGWYVDDNTFTIPVTTETTPSGETTYYAKWTPNSAASYTVHFNSNGGSSVGDMTVTAGESLGSLPEDPSKNYFVFDGWYEDDDTFTIPVTTSTTPLGETTYYAKWVLDSSYVAQVGDNYYTTLTAAFNAVTNSTPTTITIVKDISWTTRITIPSGRDITLNIGNHTITNTSTNVFESNGTLRIHDGTIRATAGSGAINNNAGAYLYVSGGTIENTSTRQAIYNKGNLYISGTAYLKTSATQRGAIDNDDASATISMTGGTVEATNAGSKTGAIRIVSGSATITGGTIISNSTSTSTSEKGDYAGGIYNKGTLVLGTQNNSHDITAPIIQAKTYAVYSTQNYSFYDGILKGVMAAVQDETKITSKESGLAKVSGTETISGTTYYTLYYQ